MNIQLLVKKLNTISISGFKQSTKAPKPAGNYNMVKRVGNMAFVSGQMSVSYSGKVVQPSQNTDVNKGYKAAQLAMANALNQLINFNEIEEIISIIRIDGYFHVNNGNDIPKMLDGASDLVFKLFGPETGKHARTVFSTNELPYHSLTEIVVIAEVK